MFGIPNTPYSDKLMLEEFIVSPFFKKNNRTFATNGRHLIYWMWQQINNSLWAPSIFIQALREHGFERKSSEQILLRGVCYSVTGEI